MTITTIEHYFTALKGWPIVGYIPQMLKAMNSAGLNNLYHKLQQELGPIYKMKGLGRYTVIMHAQSLNQYLPL